MHEADDQPNDFTSLPLLPNVNVIKSRSSALHDWHCRRHWNLAKTGHEKFKDFSLPCPVLRFDFDLLSLYAIYSPTKPSDDLTIPSPHPHHSLSLSTPSPILLPQFLHCPPHMSTSISSIASIYLAINPLHFSSDPTGYCALLLTTLRLLRTSDCALMPHLDAYPSHSIPLNAT